MVCKDCDFLLEQMNYIDSQQINFNMASGSATLWKIMQGLMTGSNCPVLSDTRMVCNTIVFIQAHVCHSQFLTIQLWACSNKKLIYLITTCLQWYFLFTIDFVAFAIFSLLNNLKHQFLASSTIIKYPFLVSSTSLIKPSILHDFFLHFSKNSGAVCS